MSIVAAQPTRHHEETPETPVFLDEGGRRAAAMRALGAFGMVAAAVALATIVLAATGFSRLTPFSAPHSRALSAHRVLAVRAPAPVQDPRRQTALALLGGARHEPGPAVHPLISVSRAGASIVLTRVAAAPAGD